MAALTDQIREVLRASEGMNLDQLMEALPDGTDRNTVGTLCNQRARAGEFMRFVEAMRTCFRLNPAYVPGQPGQAQALAVRTAGSAATAAEPPAASRQPPAASRQPPARKAQQRRGRKANGRWPLCGAISQPPPNPAKRCSRRWSSPTARPATRWRSTSTRWWIRASIDRWSMRATRRDAHSMRSLRG